MPTFTVRTAGEVASADYAPPVSAAPFPELPRLAFADEFTGASVDTSKWNVRDGHVGSNESSICWARNVSVANSCLVIQPRREASTAAGTTRQFTSGYVDTHGKVAIGKPSYTEVRAALPLRRNASRGMWPAIWFRLAKSSLEIDAMEAWGTPSDKADTGGHWQAAIWPDTMSATDGYHGWYAPSGQDLTAFHTYGLRIAADGTLSFYYDGAPVGFLTWIGGVQTTITTVTPAMIAALGWDPASDQLGLRLNLQVGQAYYGTPDAATDFTQQYLIDYVRIWGPAS